MSSVGGSYGEWALPPQHRHGLWHEWLRRPVPHAQAKPGWPGGTDEHGHRARTFHRVQVARQAEVGFTTMRAPDYGTEALPCRTLVGFDANSLHPWAMAQDMPIRLDRSGASWAMAWMPRARPTDMGSATAGPHSNGWPTRWNSVGWRACCIPTMDLRCDSACGTCLWVAVIQTSPWCSSSMAACFTVTTVASSRTPGSALLPRRCGSPLKGTKGTAGSHLPAPGTDIQALLQATLDDHVFSLTQVDIHTPKGLKDKFWHLPPIFKSVAVSKEDAGPHMVQFCMDADTHIAGVLVLTEWPSGHALVSSDAVQ